MPDTKVEVKVMGDTVTKKRWFRVHVWSNVRKGLQAVKEVDAPEGKDVERDIQAAAEACAAHQCQNYGDTHDPRDCGRAAVEALKDLQAQANRAREGRGRG
jgi:hypothetical protein